MRRSRISVRPNIARPGARGLSVSQEGQHGQGSEAVDTTHAAGTEGKEPADSGQPVQQPAGLNSSQDSLLIKVPPSLGEEGCDGGIPSGSPLTASALQRRKRFSVMPNLTKPRVTPTPRTPKSPLQTAAAPPSPTESPVPVLEDQAVEDNGADQGIGSTSVAVLGERATSPDRCGHASPTVPTTTCWEPSPEKKKNGKKEKEKAPPLDIQNESQESEPGSVKPLTPEPFLGYSKLSLGNTSPVAGPSTSNLPLKVTAASADRQRLAKARKLKKMMELEARKEKRRRKGKRPVCDYTMPLDHSKITMRDLIYYVPDANPMTSSIMEELNPEEKMTPQLSSKELPEMKPEVVVEEEEEVEDCDDSMEEEEDLLVPKVKVAEDGSLIIDEESLTVRVLRAKEGACGVEGKDAIFERGATTTYTSFKKFTYTKPWSIKETDMFFLAIKMVGSDFSLICQLFPHRTRKEVKNKFKREEKANSWRIDKAFREKRAFDLEFFRSLLELVLAADKTKRNKSNTNGSCRKKTKRKPKGKKASVKGADGDQATSDVEPDGDVAEGDSETAEKENEDCSNVTKATDATRGKRKQTEKEDENDEKEPDTAKKKVDGRKTKRSKKLQDGKKASLKGADGDQATSDVEPDGDVAEGDSEIAEKANEDCSNVTKAMDATRRGRKRTKKGEKEEKEGEEEPVTAKKRGDGRKTKRSKKLQDDKSPGEGAAGDQMTTAVEPDGDVVEGVSKPAETENESCSSVTRPTDGKKRKRSKNEEVLNSTKEKTDGRRKKLSKRTQNDEAAVIDVTEDEVANVQSVAEEASRSEETDNAAEEKKGKLSARTTRGKAGPNLGQGRRGRKVPESVEKKGDGCRIEEDCKEDGDSKVANGSGILEGKKAKRGRIAAPPSNKETPEGDLQVVADVSPALGQKLKKTTRSGKIPRIPLHPKGAEGEEHPTESPPCSPPHPEAASPKGRGKQPAKEPRPNLAGHQRTIPPSDPKLREGNEGEEHDEAQLEEEQASPAHQEEPALVPLGLPSLELAQEVLETPGCVPDSPGPGDSEGALCSESGFEGTEEKGIVLSDHRLDLLGDVMEASSPGFAEGLESGDSVDEAAQTLLSLRNTDLLSHSTAAHSPVEEEEEEPESGHADQSQCSDEPRQPVTCDVPVTAVSEPIDEPLSPAEDWAPTEEPSTLEESAAAATAGAPIRTSRSDSSVQNIPLGRRSRFPKPRPNLSESTRAPHPPPHHSTAAPSPEVCTASAAADAGSQRPAGAERNHLDPLTEEERVSKQNEEEGSVQDEFQQREALSAPVRPSRSDSSVQNVPLGRRSRFPKPRPNLSESTRTPRPPPHHSTAAPSPVDDTSYTAPEDSNTMTLVQKELTGSNTDLSAEHVTKDIAKDKVTTSPEDKNIEERVSTVETGTASSSFGVPLGLPLPHPGPAFRAWGPEAEGEETMQETPASLYTPQEAASLRVDGGAKTFVTAEGVQARCERWKHKHLDTTPVQKDQTEGVSWAEDITEEEPTFILTLFEIPQTELGEYQPGPEVLCPAGGDPFSPLMFLDPQSAALPVTVSEPQNCESLSVQTSEVESGCGSVTHLVLSEVLIPVSEGQQEGAAQDWTDLPEQSHRTDSSESTGQTSSTAVQNENMQGQVLPYEEGHGSQALDPAAGSHDPAGTDGMSERDTLSIEKRKLPVRSRRGKLQVKPCITKRKTRGSMKDEQGVLPEEPEQPGPAQTSPQTRQPTAPHPDAQQDSVEAAAAASDVSAVGELPQGIVGPSDLPEEESGLGPGAEGTENSSVGEEPQISQNCSMNSCESLSVETAEAESGCGSVTHLVLSEVLIPVSEGQQEGAAQDWTDLPEQSHRTDPSESAGETSSTAVQKENMHGLTLPYEEGHGSQALDQAAGSHDPVEAGTDGTSERDTLSIEKRKLPVRSRRGKLQVKPCITKRKTRGSMKDEQGVLPEEPEQPGPAQTSPQTRQPTAPHPDAQQDSVEEGAAASDVSAVGELPQGIVGHSDLPQEERSLGPGAEGTESTSVGEEPPIRQNRSLNSCESLSVETTQVESGCGSVTHLVLSDVLIPVSDGQEEGAFKKENTHGLTHQYEEGHGSQALDLASGSHDSVEAGTDGMSERDTLSIEKRKLPVKSRRGKLQVKPCITKRKTRGSMKDEQGVLPEEPEQPGPAQTSPQTRQPTAPHPDAQQDSVEEAAAASDVSAVGELPQGIVGHSDLPQEERGLGPGAEGTESTSVGEEPPIRQNRSLNSCESLSMETAEAKSGCGSVTHLVLSEVLIPVSEGQQEGAAQDWTDLPEQSHRTDPSESAGETSSTSVQKENMHGLTHPYEEGHGSQALDPAAGSHDPVEAGTDGTSERDTLSIEKRKLPVRSRRGKLQVKPCITKRKTRGSMKDEQGVLPEEPEQPGPAQTSPQTRQPTAPHPDAQQDSVEEAAAASDVSAVGELPQGIVGHSDLPEEESGVAPGAEGTESSSGGEVLQPSHHSTPVPQRGALTRSGRVPRGFLTFVSGSSDSGPVGAPCTSRSTSLRPQVNTSHTRRKRTTKAAVIETSFDDSTLNSPPSRVGASASLSGPSPEPESSQASASAQTEFLCGRTLETEEEPTKVSEYHFSDIFTEVEEPD